MDRWEYRTTFLQADAEEPKTRDWLKSRWPNWKVPQHSPEALVPILNEYGAEGWELISIQPVVVGDKGDVRVATTSTTTRASAYFGAFKRRIEP